METSIPQSESRSHRGYGYGPFKVKASKKMTSTNAFEVATFFDFTKVEREDIRKADNPGLALMDKLEEVSIISTANIDELLYAMERIGLQGRAAELRDDFSKIKIVEKDEVRGHGSTQITKTCENISLTPEMYPYLTKNEFDTNKKGGRETLEMLNTFNKKRYEGRVSRYTLKSHEQPQVSSHNNGNLNIALFGMTGSGKSSAANAILGRDDFRTSQSGNSATKVSCDATCIYGNRRITVVDTPGVNDNRQSKSTVEKELIRWAFLLREGIHCFIICMVAVNVRYTKDIREMIQVIKSLGGANFFQYCMVVYTNAEGALKNSSLDTYLESARKNKDHRDILDAINDRVVAVDNKADILPEIQRNRETIIAMVDITVQENKRLKLSEVYTNDITVQAEKLHKKIEETVKSNGCHPALVNAVLEGIINMSLKYALDFNEFKESVIRMLVSRDTVRVRHGTFTFNYEGKQTKVSRQMLEEQIHIIFDASYESLSFLIRFVLAFADLLRKLDKKIKMHFA